MPLSLRQPTAADVDAVAELIFNAFASIHDRHNFPRDFPSREPAKLLANAWVNHPKVFGLVAEQDGRIVGCNFLDERTSVAGVGPVCVDPATQGSGVGKRVMQAILDRARQIDAKRVRLLQDAFNLTSLSLYASLGFEVKEPAVVMRGTPARKDVGAGATARAMRESDLPACAELCKRVHGFDRNGELRDALAHFGPFVVERGGRITAYASAPSFYLLNHGVAETPEDFKDLLIGAAAQIDRPVELLVPTRNAAMFRWCLGERFRVTKPMMLMALGEYHEPRGWWWPSVEY